MRCGILGKFGEMGEMGENVGKCCFISIISAEKVKPFVCVHISAEAPVALLDPGSVVMTAYQVMNRARYFQCIL